MTADVSAELVRSSVGSLVEPVGDADAVALAVTNRIGVTELEPVTARRRWATIAAAAVLVVVTLVAGALLAGRADDPSAPTADAVDGDVRYAPSYIPPGWVVSSVRHQERRDDPALRSMQAFGTMDPDGYVSKGFIVSAFRPPVAAYLGRTSSVSRGGRSMTVDESTRTIVFKEAGVQVRLDYNGITMNEALTAAAGLQVTDDDTVDSPDHSRTFRATPPDVVVRGARWFDITLERSGEAPRPPGQFITVGIWTGQIGPWPTTFAREPGRATTVRGVPATERSEGDAARIEWRPEPGTRVVVGGPAPADEIRRIAESVERVTPEQWAAFEASGTDEAPDVASGTSDGISWRERANTRGGRWTELFVPVEDEVVRISPERGALGTSVVRIGRQTIVGFVVEGHTTRASADGIEATRLQEVPLPDGRVGVVARFDRLLDPLTIDATVDGANVTVDLERKPVDHA